MNGARPPFFFSQKSAAAECVLHWSTVPSLGQTLVAQYVRLVDHPVHACRSQKHVIKQAVPKALIRDASLQLRGGRVRSARRAWSQAPGRSPWPFLPVGVRDQEELVTRNEEPCGFMRASS